MYDAFELSRTLTTKQRVQEFVRILIDNPELSVDYEEGKSFSVIYHDTENETLLLKMGDGDVTLTVAQVEKFVYKHRAVIDRWSDMNWKRNIVHHSYRAYLEGEFIGRAQSLYGLVDRIEPDLKQLLKFKYGVRQPGVWIRSVVVKGLREWTINHGVNKGTHINLNDDLFEVKEYIYRPYPE